MPTREMNMNGAKGTRYTDQDYADIRHGMDVLKDDLRGKNAAEQARDLKNWLAMHRPAFVRQWKSIMSHMGPPGVDTAHQKDGVITRARHARNLEEARANLEARRAQDAHLTLQEIHTEETEKEKVLQKEFEELKAAYIAALEEKQAELAKVKNNCSHLEKQTDAAAKEAKDKMNEAEAKSKELDAKETEVERANERAAEAEREKEEYRERAEQEKEEKEKEKEEHKKTAFNLLVAQAQVSAVSESAESYALEKRQLIKGVSSLKHKLIESERNEERKKICMDNEFQQIKLLYNGGDVNAAGEKLEEMKRRLIVRPQSSAGAGFSGDAHGGMMG
jgi:myosin heavy subunit